jgi:two-component system cell cycle sensor histidine kinase/response regulator CckA
LEERQDGFHKSSFGAVFRLIIVQSLERGDGVINEEKCIRILHLEDSAEDAELVKRMVEQDGLRCRITVAPNKSSFETALGRWKYDLILCDHSVPGYDGFVALRLALQRQPDAPVIMLSGTLDDVQAVESLKSGATDYILKQRLARLVPAFQRALHEAEEHKRQQAADERIREQANLLNLTGDAIIVRTVDDRIVSWNKGAEALFGWSEVEALHQDFGSWVKGAAMVLALAKKRLLESGDWMGELQLKSKTGEEIIIFSRWKLMRDKDGKPQAILSANTDITEKKKLEAIALRAQRMDSIGALAGGIAHDLNNALAPVLMSVELLKKCQDDAGRHRFLDIINSSAQRAKGMVKQILRFGRGQGGTGPVQVSQLVREMTKIVQDTFPKSITISIESGGEELCQVLGDVTELHQVLLNLCVNARDAMTKHGRLTVSAQNFQLNQEAAKRLNAAPGSYVMLSVADTGSGIPPEVLPRIFEPFFSTKSPDNGTGLGLSTVANIVKRHGGCIDVETELGKGTKIKIYLPAIAAPAEGAEAKCGELDLPVGHGELILIIEDEEAVCELTKTTLENYGYRVVTAHNGIEGISRFEEHKREIRVLVTDTDMPYMDGMGAIHAIKEMKPDLPVIIASGSRRDPALTQKVDMDSLTNLGKPFSAAQLLMAVGMAVQR